MLAADSAFEQFAVLAEPVTVFVDESVGDLTELTELTELSHLAAARVLTPRVAGQAGPAALSATSTP